MWEPTKPLQQIIPRVYRLKPAKLFHRRLSGQQLKHMAKGTRFAFKIATQMYFKSKDDVPDAFFK